jgi:hypothetical protein
MEENFLSVSVGRNAPSGFQFGNLKKDVEAIAASDGDFGPEILWDSRWWPNVAERIQFNYNRPRH